MIWGTMTFPESLSAWIVGPDGHAFSLLDGPWAGCRETTVFWPDDEACDATCCLPAGHGPADRHYDQILGWWQD